MFHYCLNALTMLVLSPALEAFKKNSELEAWFKDRMLEGTDHFIEKVGPVRGEQDAIE